MSRENGEKSKALPLSVFIIGVFLILVGVAFTLGGIWMSGGHHHGLGGKLGATSAVFYVLGAICTVTGGANTWDWG